MSLPQFPQFSELQSIFRDIAGKNSSQNRHALFFRRFFSVIIFSSFLVFFSFPAAVLSPVQPAVVPGQSHGEPAGPGRGGGRDPHPPHHTLGQGGHWGNNAYYATCTNCFLVVNKGHRRKIKQKRGQRSSLLFGGEEMNFNSLQRSLFAYNDFEE